MNEIYCEQLNWRFQCPQRWELLKETSDPAIRYCEACAKPVYHCRDVPELIASSQAGRCIAVEVLRAGESDEDGEMITLLGDFEPDWRSEHTKESR